MVDISHSLFLSISNCLFVPLALSFNISIYMISLSVCFSLPLSLLTTHLSRSVENLVETRSTLQSLSSLLSQISNIVITQDIARLANEQDPSDTTYQQIKVRHSFYLVILNNSDVVFGRLNKCIALSVRKQNLIVRLIDFLSVYIIN